LEAKTPVIAGSTQQEVVYRTPPEPGNPPSPSLPAILRPNDPYGLVLTRWEPTPEERRAIADGASVYVMVYTFNTPMQPFFPATEVPQQFAYALPHEDWPEELQEGDGGSGS
jgi:hypothetical protein